jgi:DNA-binding NarL/FixJ family response regulator
MAGAAPEALFFFSGMATAKTVVGMKILIAEDTESVRFALRLAVEYFGHEVVGTATDGQDALEQYKRTHPEVVLMDIRMPRMDGLKCASMMAQQDPNARIVLLTGGRTTEADALRAGARGFLEKPFDLFELGRLVSALTPA